MPIQCLEGIVDSLNTLETVQLLYNSKKASPNKDELIKVERICLQT